MNKKTDNPRCEKCNGITAFVSGIFYYEQDSEPYISGLEEEAKHSEGESEVTAFICDNCGNMQGLYSTD